MNDGVREDLDTINVYFKRQLRLAELSQQANLVLTSEVLENHTLRAQRAIRKGQEDEGIDNQSLDWKFADLNLLARFDPQVHIRRSVITLRD